MPASRPTCTPLPARAETFLRAQALGLGRLKGTQAHGRAEFIPDLSRHLALCVTVKNSGHGDKPGHATWTSESLCWGFRAGCWTSRLEPPGAYLSLAPLPGSCRPHRAIPEGHPRSPGARSGVPTVPSRLTPPPTSRRLLLSALGKAD